MSFPPRPSSRRLVESRRGLLFEASTRQSPFVRNEAGCPAKNCGASALKTPFCTCGTPDGEVDARQDTANQILHVIGPAASRCREPLKHDASLEEGAMASNGGHRVCCPPASSLVCYLALIGSTNYSIDAWREVLGGLRTTYQESVQLANGVKRFILSHSPGYLDSSSPPTIPNPGCVRPPPLPPASPQLSGPRRASNLLGPTPVPSRRLTFACRSCVNHFRRRVPFASIISVSPSRPLNLDRRPPRRPR
jgi:hypothetical protein